jgi:hypothetical protein
LRPDLAEGYYNLGSVYLELGDRAAALAQYRECVRTLSRELGVPPLAETTRLYEAISEGTLEVPTAPPAAAAPALPRSLYEQLDPRGRLVVPVGERRAQRLQLFVRSPEGPAMLRSVPCRFVPLLGEEGFRGD